MINASTKQQVSKSKQTSAQSRLDLPHWFLRPAVQISILLLLGFGIYLNTLYSPFIFDDETCIVSNPAIRNLKYYFNFDLVRALNLSQDLKNSFALRPVVYLTFTFNYLLGGEHEFGFHLVNTAIHLANAVLVYLLVGVTLRLAPLPAERPGGPTWDKVLPFLVALLFVAHPIQTQAVTYIVQRFTSLVAFFYFAGILLYIQSQLTQRQHLRRIYYGSSLLITILAMKSKETAFTLPAILLLYDLFFLPGTWRQRCYRLFPFLLTMAIIPVTLLTLTQANSEAISGIALTKSMNLVNFTGIDRWDYLQTQFGVIVVYLRLLFLPIGQNFDHDYRLAQNFFEWRVAGALLFLLSLLGYACLLAFRSFHDKSRYEERIIAFGILWFFVTLSVESSIIPIDDLLFEYRIYLPSYGIFLASVTAVGSAVNHRLLPWRGTIGTILILVTLLAVATVARNRLYRNNIRLLEDVVTKSPEKPRAHALLGFAYLRLNYLDQAEVEFKKVLQAKPNDAEVMVNLGNIYFAKEDYFAAIEQYRNSLEFFFDNPPAHGNLGVCYQKIGKTAEAEQALLKSLAISPGFRDGRKNLATLYEIQGRYAEASFQYQKLLEYYPKDQYALERVRYLANQGWVSPE